MDVIITPKGLSGSVRAIASKSYAHRLLICSALADKKTFIECAETSEDIEASIRCLKALGAGVDETQDGFTVTPVVRGGRIKNAVLNCGESGSTLRFMLPVACALGAEAVFKMGGRLPNRPMEPLVGELISHGCTVIKQGDILKSSGKLEGGHFALPGHVSSQYVSGLFFALPLLETESVIELRGEIESKNYILMTLHALKMFGIDIKSGGNSFYINGGESFVSPETVTVEGDWSNAAFWFCAGALGGSGIECTGLDMNSLQGDKSVAELLSGFGAEVLRTENGARVKSAPLCGTEIDARDIPDLVPALSAVASAARGKTVIKNATRLRIKESDRLAAVTSALSALGADISETGDGLIINGREGLQGGTADSFGDHRIAMMLAIASIVCENPVVIKNAEAVNKSYPNFFTDFTSLGGAVIKGE